MCVQRFYAYEAAQDEDARDALVLNWKEWYLEFMRARVTRQRKLKKSEEEEGLSEHEMIERREELLERNRRAQAGWYSRHGKARNEKRRLARQEAKEREKTDHVHAQFFLAICICSSVRGG